MDIDQNTASREAEDRLREERRGANGTGGRADREPRDRPYQQGPRQDYRGYGGDDYYNRGPPPPRRQESSYQDARYGYGGGERYRGRGGGYREDGRLYSDRMPRGGQNWRS